MKIDENLIYKKSYEAMRDAPDLCMECDVSGKEVGNFIDGVNTMTRKLLNVLEEE